MTFHGIKCGFLDIHNSRKYSHTTFEMINMAKQGRNNACFVWILIRILYQTIEDSYYNQKGRLL